MKFQTLQAQLLRTDKQNLARNLGYYNLSNFKNAFNKITAAKSLDEFFYKGHCLGWYHLTIKIRLNS